MALAPFPGIETGMRRDAMDDELEVSAPLAARLRRAAWQRRFEHEHGIAFASARLDRRARRPAPDLLIGRPQHRDREARRRIASSRSARTASIATPMPAFMSKMPGPCSRPASSRQRHAIELADRPDGVEVAKKQHMAPAPGNSARMWSPRAPPSSRSIVPPIASRRRVNSAPQRSTAALSVLGDSSPTSVSMTSRTQPARASHQARRSEGVDGVTRVL